MNELVIQNPVKLIYQSDGSVDIVQHGVTEIPENQVDCAIIASAPSHYRGVRVDVETKTAIWDVLPDTEEEVTNTQVALADHEERLLALEASLKGE